MHDTQQRKENLSLGELFAELSRESTTLVRQEIALAKTEIFQKASRVGKDIGFLFVGGAVLYAGFLAIMGAVILLLGALIPWWLAALLVGVIVAGVGYGMVQKGRDALTHEDLAPRRTLDELKESAEWAKEQTK
jgi:hypothetical protein